MPEDYKQAVQDFYAAAAVKADPSLCCVDGAVWSFPGLAFPPRMLEMNYGCGSTVHPSDLSGEEPVLYVGVGGGVEALQFAYFRRRPGGVIAVDPVAEMREAAGRNLEEAARMNPWFRPEFVRIVEGTAESLPVEDGSVGVVAQNCLFNVFTDADLARALAEVERALAIGGRFSCSDPIATSPIPEALKRNATLRARCISGCTSYERYLAALHASGFQRLLVRARRPYRLLLPAEFPELEKPILLESLEVLAIKTGGTAPQPDVFTGRHVVYVGADRFAAHDGNSFPAGIPLHVSDRLAAELGERPDFVVTPPTYHARSAGCC